MNYYGDRNTLIRDLIRSDYFIESAAPNPTANGQRFEIRIRGGTVVSWDEKTGTLFAQGTDAAQVDAKLKKLYSSGFIARFWAQKHEFILSNTIAVILAVGSVLAGIYLSKR
jgi:hypothetical protein